MAKPTTSFRLGGVPEHFNLPWRLALESGQLDDLNPSWTDQPGGTGQMLTGLAEGELDLVSILTEGTVAAIDGGADLTIIQVYVQSPLQWGVFVPACSSIETEGDLKGARIAISRFNSGSHLMAFIHGDEFGWTVDPSQFVVVGGLDGAVEAFAQGEADLFLWDQYMTSPLVEAGQFRQVGVLASPWPSFVIAAPTEVLTVRTTEVGRVVDAVVAQAAGLHHRPGIEKLLTDRYDLGPEAAGEWLASTTFASRSAMDPTIAVRVLDTLGRAGAC